jgi:hypothetical protein
MRRLRREKRLGRGGVPGVLWSLVRRLRPSIGAAATTHVQCYRVYKEVGQ